MKTAFSKTDSQITCPVAPSLPSLKAVVAKKAVCFHVVQYIWCSAASSDVLVINELERYGRKR
jgi:hypothetical protein